MTKLSLAFVAASLFSLAGCPKPKADAPDLTGKYTEFKDAMCKCKAGDAACAQKVLDDQKKWSDDLAAKADKNAKVVDSTEAVAAAKKLEPITTEMGKCMTAAMTPATIDTKPVEPTGSGSGSGSGDTAKPEANK